MAKDKELYLSKAKELCNDDLFFQLVNQYPDDFFNLGYWRYFKRLQDPSEFLILIDAYKKENKGFEDIRRLADLKVEELSKIILWAFNRDEAEIGKRESLEKDVEEATRNLKKSSDIYRPRKKDSENRSPGYGIFQSYNASNEE